MIQPLTCTSTLHPFTKPFQFFPQNKQPLCIPFYSDLLSRAACKQHLSLCCIHAFNFLWSCSKGNVILLFGWVYSCYVSKRRSLNTLLFGTHQVSRNAGAIRNQLKSAIKLETWLAFFHKIIPLILLNYSWFIHEMRIRFNVYILQKWCYS